MAKRKKSPSLFGAIVVAAILGIAIGVVIFNPLEDPLPAPPEVDIEGEYDDEWGKLQTPVAQAEVRHILVSWKGKNQRVTPKDPERTEEEARELIVELWHKYRNDPTVKNWNELAKEHTEDSGAYTQTYTCKAQNSGLDESFNKTGLSTKPGHARIAFDGEFGFHLIRVEE